MESQVFSQPLHNSPGRGSGGRTAAQPQQAPPPQALFGAAPSSAGRQAAVAFVDPADGRRWTVVEQRGDAIPGARGPSCLCFQAQDIFRRVWQFPANWRELSHADLAALSRSW